MRGNQPIYLSQIRQDTGSTEIDEMSSLGVVLAHRVKLLSYVVAYTGAGVRR